MVEDNPAGPIARHITPTDTRCFLRGAHGLPRGGAQTSHASHQRFSDLNTRATSDTPHQHPPTSRPGRSIHPIPRQERQLKPTHQLRRLYRRPETSYAETRLFSDLSRTLPHHLLPSLPTDPTGQDQQLVSCKPLQSRESTHIYHHKKHHELIRRTYAPRSKIPKDYKPADRPHGIAGKLAGTSTQNESRPRISQEREPNT